MYQIRAKRNGADRFKGQLKEIVNVSDEIRHRIFCLWGLSLTISGVAPTVRPLRVSDKSESIKIL